VYVCVRALTADHMAVRKARMSTVWSEDVLVSIEMRRMSFSDGVREREKGGNHAPARPTAVLSPMISFASSA